MFVELSPTAEDFFSQDQFEKYINNFFFVLFDIQNKLIRIATNFNFGDNVINTIHILFEKYRNRLMMKDINMAEMSKNYDKICAEMDENLISSINSKISGYYLFSSNVEELINQCTSINEVLHLMHFYITNNDQFYHSLSAYKSGTMSSGFPIRLYGDENFISNDAFNIISSKDDCDDTDIISLKDKLIIMVRGKGHALTIEINLLENGEMWIDYFIPKICNLDMMRRVVGIKKIDEANNYAVGSFKIEREMFCEYFSAFIDQIPTDNDMVFPPFTVEMLESANISR